MKIRFPLYLQTLGFLAVHLAVLALLVLVLFNSQFGQGWEALLSSPAGDRVDGVSHLLRQQFQSRPADTWNGILSDFGKLYAVKFYVFDRRGHEIAGEPVTLPQEVTARIVRRRPGPGEFGPPPPMPQREGSARTRERMPRGRFLVHTNSPEQFWICVRFGIPTPEATPDAMPSPDGMFIPGTLIAATASLWTSRILFDFWMVLVAVCGILALSVIIWWPFVYSITHAMAQVTAMTERIAEGRFDARLNVNRADEIGALADAVNSMAQRLDNFVTGQKRFLGDTAHELCSPIGRLQIALELLESSGTADQEATIADIKEDVEEMSSLINELLAFSKAGLQGKEIQLSQVKIEPVLQSVILKTSCEKLVSVEASPDLTVLGDPLLLERALGNIIRNAVRYASQDGPISVKAQRSGDFAVITVTDSGPGVPEEAINLLGQPFYRVEQSRSRSSGGVGLGLTIVKTCIEACGGTFKVRNWQPRGLQVELKLRV